MDVSQSDIRWKQKYFSLYGQDRLINDRIFQNESHGIFVDVGAGDGISPSNSLFFERELGWWGICLEILPSQISKLSTHRKAKCLSYALSKKSESRTYYWVQPSENLSDFADSWNSSRAERIRKEGAQIRPIQIECKTLPEILNEHGLKAVDYLSLDSRMIDSEALESVDFKQMGCRAISFENRSADVRSKAIFESQNFEQIAKLGNAEIYVRSFDGSLILPLR